MLSYLIERSIGIRTFLLKFRSHRKIWLINLILVDIFLAIAPATVFVWCGVFLGDLTRASALTNLIALPLIYVLIKGLFWVPLVGKPRKSSKTN